jgi:hypothetical protein
MGKPFHSAGIVSASTICALDSIHGKTPDRVAIKLEARPSRAASLDAVTSAIAGLTPPYQDSTGRLN